jgi:glycosyltransferase family protein
MGGLSVLKYIYIEFKYIVLKSTCKLPKVFSIDESLDIIINSNKSVARFGDGELHMLNNKGSIGFQDNNFLLSQKLKEVISSDDEKCFVCLPKSLESLDGFNVNAYRFWKFCMVLHYKNYKSFLNFDKKYLNSFITRPYIDYSDKRKSANYFNKIREIWRDKKILIVEGKNTRLGCNNDLFKNAKDLKRVITLDRNAFSVYDKIYSYIKDNSKEYELVLIALGPTATVLAFELSKLDIRAIDIGHVDIEYEWFLRGVDEKVAIEGKFVNEVESNLISTEIDADYRNEILAEIF